MTREERDKAIRILQWLHDNYFLFRSTEEDVKYATKLAIQELQKEPSISEDGTLTVNVEDGSKLSRVLVCGDNHFGGLYYPEQETVTEFADRCRECGERYGKLLKEQTGRWIDTGSGQECSNCHEIQYGYDNHRVYCANCGSRNEVSK